ncbi:hypothetical protein ABIF16_002169 [Bradyrhizobium elkanii]
MHVHELQWIEPVEALRCFAQRPQLTFLDSAAGHQLLGRYSYLACEPFGTYVIADGQASWNGEALAGDPWAVLRDLLGRYKEAHCPDLPPFQGGAAGFLAYDLNRTLERLPAPSVPGSAIAPIDTTFLRRGGQLRSPGPQVLDRLDRMAGAGSRSTGQACASPRRRVCIAACQIKAAADYHPQHSGRMAFEL